MPGTLYDNPNLFTESVSAVTATNTVQLGAVRYWNGSMYKYVYNGDTAVAYPGYAVQLASGGSGNTISVSMTTGDAAFGVVQNATLTTATYGWVMRQGLAMITPASGGLSASKIIGVTGSGSFCDLSAVMVAYASGATGGSAALSTMYQPVGRTLGSAATNTSILASVNFASN